MRFDTCCRTITLALMLGTAAALAAPASAGSFSVSVRIGYEPPPLPVYVQPPPPAPEYIWTPGYWAWDPDATDYYWVPGVWVRAPEPGLLWTPPWWGWDDGAYVFHSGYWAPHVGFYGGIVYGFGYTGRGYEGGYWQGPHFFYNRTVNNVTNVHITNVYNKTVIVQKNYTRISYNGGPRGVGLRPTPEQMRFARDRHLDPTGPQLMHLRQVRNDDQSYFSANRGSPRVGAMSRPDVWHANDRHDTRAVEPRGDRPADMGPGRGPDRMGFAPDSSSPAVSRPDHGARADRNMPPPDTAGRYAPGRAGDMPSAGRPGEGDHAGDRHGHHGDARGTPPEGKAPPAKAPASNDAHREHHDDRPREKHEDRQYDKR